MSRMVEVRFNDEEPVVLPASPYPGDATKFDYTATVEHALAERAKFHPDRDPVTVDTYVCFAPHEFADGEVNVAQVGTTFGAGQELPEVDEGSNENDDAGEA